MDGKDLASLFVKRLDSWGLEWEVLWITFQRLIDEGVKEELIEKALREGFREWDI